MIIPPNAVFGELALALESRFTGLGKEGSISLWRLNPDSLAELSVQVTVTPPEVFEVAVS